VTFVLCACFPVQRETRDGQQRAVVTKWFFKKVPSFLRCLSTSGIYDNESSCRS